jgi:outer membrane lipoprotein-sorting protein
MERTIQSAMLALSLFVLPGATARALPLIAAPLAAAEQPRPEVAALISRSTSFYRKLKSYSTDITIKTTRSAAGQTESEETRFLLALDRPNRFCYRDTSAANGTAAVCNGTQFTNYKPDRKQYQQMAAPADFQGINIVDDVSFEPLGGYIVALMLRGDAYADKDVKAALNKATIDPAITEGGKKLQVMRLPFGPQEEKYLVYFAEDGQIVKTVLSASAEQIKVSITELFQDVKLDKPVDPAIFIYTPPASARKVEKFTAPQRLFDARVSPTHSGIHLASYAPPTASMNKDVTAILDSAGLVYGKMKSYRHTATFRASGMSQGKKVDQAATFMLAMARPNKFAFKMVSKAAVSVASDGKTVVDYRAGEYTQRAAPSTLKELPLDQDDFDPVAGSFVIAHLLKGTVYTDPSLLGILLKATGRQGLTIANKTYDVIELPVIGITFVLYFDPSTHLLFRAAAKVPDQDITLTETYEDVQVDKEIPDSVFAASPPVGAKKVNKLSR